MLKRYNQDKILGQISVDNISENCDPTFAGNNFRMQLFREIYIHVSYEQQTSLRDQTYTEFITTDMCLQLI